MLKKIIMTVAVLSILAAIICLSCVPTLAKWGEGSEKEPDASKVLAEKGVIISNINALRNQETRVAVLQQFLSEENAKLLKMQAVFCDQYSLDLDKFRAGKYQYNADDGEFSEKK
jgi:hypothetical protein